VSARPFSNLQFQTHHLEQLDAGLSTSAARPPCAACTLVCFPRSGACPPRVSASPLTGPETRPCVFTCSQEQHFHLFSSRPRNQLAWTVLYDAHELPPNNDNPLGALLRSGPACQRNRFTMKTVPSVSASTIDLRVSDGGIIPGLHFNHVKNCNSSSSPNPSCGFRH
jgi:hypothetical protein